MVGLGHGTTWTLGHSTTYICVFVFWPRLGLWDRSPRTAGVVQPSWTPPLSRREFTRQTLDTAAVAEMKCEHCLVPLGPPQTAPTTCGLGHPRPAENAPDASRSAPCPRCPGALVTSSTARQTAETNNRVTCPRWSLTPTLSDPTLVDTLYFGKNTTIKICKQKAEPWSWAEEEIG